MHIGSLTYFLKQIPKNGKVLDVGCGTGKALRAIKEQRPDIVIVGLDPVNQLPESLREVSFVQGSAEELPSIFKEDEFDGVFCQHLLEHLLFPEKFFEGVGYILRRGGVCFVETPNWSRLLLFFHKSYFYNDPTHRRPFTKRAILELFKMGGLQTLRLKTIGSIERNKIRSIAHWYDWILFLLCRDIVVGIGMRDDKSS